MAALDFPDAPTVGQVFDKWTWNGTAWVLTGSSGTEAAKPSTPAAGYRYWATDTKRDLLYDGTGWIIMTEPLQPFTFSLSQGAAAVTANPTPGQPTGFTRSGGWCDVLLSAQITGSGVTGWGVAVATTGLPPGVGAPRGTFSYNDAGIAVYHGMVGLGSSMALTLATNAQAGGFPTGYPSMQMTNGDFLDIIMRYVMTTKYTAT